MRPLRFAMVTTFYPPYAFGGDAIYLQRLSQALAQRGHAVEVIHCKDSYRALAGREPAAPPEAIPGVTVHGLESGMGRLSPLATQQTGYPLFKQKALRALLETRPFDVIHYHNISLIGGPGILRYGRGIKLYTTHEHWLVCPTHVLFKFGREACVKPNCLPCVLQHRRPPQLWRYTGLLRAALRHVDALLSPSEFTIRRHREAGIEGRFEHLPLFVNEPCAGSETAELTGISLPQRPFYLFVGRLEKIKGLQTILPLFRRYQDADLVIAGDGDYAAGLRQMAAGCDHIHFVGRLTPEQVRGLYTKAIALIVPSITFETFGQVLIEANAMRLPVIARDLGPFPEIVRRGNGGLLFHDEASLLSALQQLQADTQLRERLAESGYAAYRARYTEEAHLCRYLELIEELSSAASARSAGVPPALPDR